MQNSAKTPRCVVRYPRTALIGPTIFLVISAVGFWMAISGKGHWTLWHVGGFAAVGILFLLNVTMYRTTLSLDAVEQRAFPWTYRRLRYVDIVRIEWKWAGTGRMLLLVSTEGKSMKIYGSTAHLIEAREALFDQVPQAFETRD